MFNLSNGLFTVLSFTVVEFSFLAPCPVSGLIIQGDKDDIVNETDVALFANKLDSQRAISIKYKKVKNADHTIAEPIANKAR